MKKNEMGFYTSMAVAAVGGLLFGGLASIVGIAGMVLFAWRCDCEPTVETGISPESYSA